MVRKTKETMELDQSDMKKTNAAAGAKLASENAINRALLEEDAAENIAAEYRSRCGGALRAMREKQGLTTQEVANRLRLSSKQIDALEADNFASLPEATIVKGFIRNYAKLLKINSEPLLDAYNVLVPEKAPQSFTLKPSAHAKVDQFKKPNLKRFLLTVLALILGLGVWLFYQNYVQKPSPVKPTVALAKPSIAEMLPEAALPAAERIADETTTQLTLPPGNAAASATEVPAAANTSLPVANSVVSNVASSNMSATNTNIPSPVAAGVQLAPQPPVLDKALSTLDAVTDVGAAVLELNANQETWVSIIDASGKEIYNKTLFAGNRELINVKPPLNMIVGNAHGATLSVNGKPMDLAPYTRVNVAHIKIN